MVAGALRYYVQIVIMFTRADVRCEMFSLLNMSRDMTYHVPEFL